MTLLKKIADYCEQNSQRIIWVFMVLYFIFIAVFCVIKFANYGYNALDLGIYNQVFYNSAHGNFFDFTVHPHSYLGDHFEIFIFTPPPPLPFLPAVVEVFL